MRILFLSGDRPDLPDQGNRIRAHYLLRGLASVHETYLLTTGPEPPDPTSAVVSLCKAFRHVPVSSWQMQMQALLNPGLPLTVGARQQPAVARAVREMAADYQVDLIYAYQHRMAPHALLVPGVRVVLDLTDCLSHYRSRMAAASRLPWRLYHQMEAARLRRFERSVLRKADLAFFVSEEDAAIARSLAPGARVEVVPNGVDVAAYSTVPSDRQAPTLVFVGHMQYPPNVDGLLAFYREAFPAIAQAISNVRLLVVGKDPAPVVQALTADPRVVITGTVPDVRPYLQQAAVAICPIRFAGGTRLKILEAMAAGLPVVSTEIGCEGLAMEPDRHLLVVEEPARMASPIIALLQDPARRAELAGRALERVVERYDWKALGRNLATRLTGV